MEHYLQKVEDQLEAEVVKAFELDPPKDLKTFLYRCDDHFHVDILKDMLKDDNLIGFLAIDAKDTWMGFTTWR